MISCKLKNIVLFVQPFYSFDRLDKSLKSKLLKVSGTRMLILEELSQKLQSKAVGYEEAFEE